MSPTVLDLPRAPAIGAPEHPELARLWTVALGKFELQEGRAPETRADWQAVVRDYDQLRSKTRGPLAQVILERCAEQPGGT